MRGAKSKKEKKKYKNRGEKEKKKNTTRVNDVSGFQNDA